MTSLRQRRSTSVGIAILLSLFLAIPAPAAAPSKRAGPSPDPLAALIAMEQRAVPIIQQLITRNAHWCPDTTAAPGWLLGDRRLYSDAVWPRANALYNANDASALFVAALDPAGPAAKAGLRVGDAIQSINGIAITTQSKDPHARMASAHALLASLPPQSTITVTTQRGATLEVHPARGCASEFRIEATYIVEAKADGLLVLISAGLVRFADNDDELATVIAHELSHNILRHRLRLNQASITRGLAQHFGRNARLTRMTEIEADRLSVWLMVDAGIDPASAVQFWTNFGKRQAGGVLEIFQSPTHPKWRQRVKQVTEEAALIRQMRAINPNAISPLVTDPPVLK